MAEFNQDSSFSSGEYVKNMELIDNQNPDESEQLKQDKEHIYSHPIFPLLQQIFHKCELASNSSRDRTSGDITSAESFNEDIAQFAKQIEDGHQKKPTIDMSDELDQLMILSIQVLRYHLLEMDKVHELCTNFTDRYIDCLKGKMPMDAVIDDRESPKPEEDENQMLHNAGKHHPSMMLNMQNNHQNQTINHHKTEVREEHQHPSQPLAIQSMTHSRHHHLPMLDLSGGDQGPSSNESGGGDSDSEGRKSSSNKKRGLFPKQATNILRAWLFQNLTHPYPSEEQKKHLSQQTGLTILQVNNWFINARRRIVQPMIDQSNRAVTAAMPYDPRVMGSFAVGMDQQQHVAAAAMLSHGMSFNGFPGAGHMLNVSAASGLPISSSSSLHGVRPDQFYSASSLNSGLTFPSTAHSSISPADLHMLSHC